MHSADLNPFDINPMAELPGFRSGSEVLVLINGRFAAKYHEISKSSTGAYLTSDTLEPRLIQAVINIKTRESLYWGDWGSMSEELSMAIWNARPEDLGAPTSGGAQAPSLRTAPAPSGSASPGTSKKRSPPAVEKEGSEDEADKDEEEY